MRSLMMIIIFFLSLKAFKSSHQASIRTIRSPLGIPVPKTSHVVDRTTRSPESVSRERGDPSGSHIHTPGSSTVQSNAQYCP